MLASNKESPNKYSRGFKISLVEGAVTTLGSTLTSPMLVPYLVRLGASVEELGIYTAASQVLLPASQIFAAIVVDRFRRRRLELMTACALLNRLSWLLIALSALGLWGGCREVMAVAVLSQIPGAVAALAWVDLMADVVSVKVRGRAFGLRNSLMGLISVAGFLITHALFASLPYPTSYATSFSVGAALLLLAVPLLYAYGDPVRPEGRGLGVKELFRALKEREVVRDSLSMACWSSATGLVGAVWTYHLMRAIGATEDWIIAINITAAVTGILANLPWGKAYDRFGPKGVFKLAGPGIVLIPVLFPNLRSLAGQVALQAYSTFLWTGFNLSTFNYSLSYEPKLRHVYMAVFSSIPALASAAASYIGALVYGSYGELTFYLSGAARVLALALLVKYVTPRDLTYEELRLSAHMYRVAIVTKEVATYAALETLFVLRVVYAAVALAILLSALIALYLLALKLLGLGAYVFTP